MNEIAAFLLHSEAGHFFLFCAYIAIVGGMPSPTKDSGIAYSWLFGSLNLFALNFFRIKPPRVENSPNFDDAVQKRVADMQQGSSTAGPAQGTQPLPKV